MPGKGGKYCVAGFTHQRSCRNSSRSEGISMHMFPRNEKKRAAWTSFVRKHRPNWNPTATSALCSAHFCGSDFTQRLDINVPPAVDRTPSSISCKRFLNSEAVPTVDDYDIASQTFPQTTTPVPATPQILDPSTLRAKRRLLREATSSQSTQRARVAHQTEGKHADDNIGTFPDHEVEFESIFPVESPSVFSPQETPVRNTAEHSHELKKCKEKLKTVQQKCSNHRKTIKRLQLKLKANANGSSSNNEHCEQQCLEESEANEMCCTNQQQEKTDGNVNVDPDELDEYLVEADEMNDIEDQKNDPNWENLECEAGVGDDMEEDTNTSNEKNRVRVDREVSPQDEPKFIVFLSCLVSLFSMFCFNCKLEKPEILITKNGTMVTVVQICKGCKNSGKEPFKWYSQPFVFGRYPAGNLLLSFAILVAGASVSKVLLVFSHLGLSAYSARTFFCHQKNYLFPTIIKFWESTRSGLIGRVKLARESIWAGDGRFDSMGHSAKYGAYTMLCASIGKIVHFELLQANETGSSQAMELQGAVRSFKFLHEARVHVQIFISDRHRGIAKWLRDTYPFVQHFYDIWHVSKSITKKLTKLAKEKGSEIVAEWIKPIRNHLYWCACSTKPGYEGLLLAKWKSYARHITNIHTNHPDQVFKSCVHEELPRRKWIKMGTDVYDKVVSICGKTQMLNDIRKLSSVVQTSQVEAFHSTLNQFHPKMTGFSYTGTYCRHILAIAHFNENVKREVKKTKRHTLVFTIQNTKMGKNCTKEAMVLKIKEFSKKIPGPLSSQFDDKLDRHSAIEKYMRRQEMVVQLFPPLIEQERLQKTINDQQTHGPAKKTPCCKKCKKPMKGHKRGQC